MFILLRLLIKKTHAPFTKVNGAFFISSFRFFY